MTDFKNQSTRRPGAHAPAFLTALVAAALLSACGGGGGNPGAVGPNTSGSTTGAGSTTGTTGSTGSTGTTGTGSTGGTTATAAAPASLQFVLAAPADKSIVIKGQGGSGRTETATLTFKLLDVNGNPLANQEVDFSTTSTDVTLLTAKANTDASGQVIATVNSGASPTTFRVQAKAASKPDLTTLSDTITVTTGLATQASFSMSADIYNVEGLNYDSSPTSPAAHVQVLLADAFHNPVADGTPIVFQTNAGAVGSSDRGGCTTVNGGCAVDFRAQAPRTPTPGQPQTVCNTTGSDGKGAGIAPDINRPGVATVCASSTTGATTLFSSIPLVLSGSDVGYVYLDSVTKQVDLATGDLGSISGGGTRNIALQIDDVNRNPMPAGTKVEITNPQNLTVSAVSPAAVPNMTVGTSLSLDPSGASGYSQGSWHKFTVTSSSACPGGAGQSATFTLTVTTPGPKGQTTQTPTVSSIPFKLSITCP